MASLLRCLPPRAKPDDDGGVISTQMMLANVLIGAGAVAAGAFGIRSPAGDRFAAALALALVVGAGVGVAALAVGAMIAGTYSDTVFLVASALGLVATLASLAALWRREARVSAARQR